MRASSVVPRAVTWLWFPFIPIGKITVVAGAMGQAKSLLTCWLAAYATTNGAVIMLSAEDDPADTIRPRLEAAHASLERIEIAEDVTLDANRLAAMCDELGDVKLITIDPIQAYLPSTVNSWKGQDVRIALEPVRELAAERKIAIVLIQHLNRRTDGDPLARIADSQGVPQLARSVLIWGPDPSDPEGDQGSRKVLTRAKGNLARSTGDSPTFQIVEHAVAGGLRAPALERGADVQVAADDVVADHETRTARDEAVDWLRDLLADGPITAKEVRQRARADGVSDRTLDRAKARLRVISEPSRDKTSISGWTWRLPDSHTYTHGVLDVLGNVGDVDKDANNVNNVNNATDTEKAPRFGMVIGGAR